MSLRATDAVCESIFHVGEERNATISPPEHVEVQTWPRWDNAFERGRRTISTGSAYTRRPAAHRRTET
jgi:hypothetical protein